LPPRPANPERAGGASFASRIPRQENPMAETIRVAVFVGSLRADSYNRRLALALARLAPETFTFEHVSIGDLPLYNQDQDANPPEAMTRLKQEVERAQALLFVTPEYNRGVPGVLKNALDTASRPWGKNSFAGKPGGVVGVSFGAIGTALAQHQLRNVLAYLDVPTLGQPEVYLQFSEGLIDESGNVSKDDTRLFLQGWVDAYVAWVRRFASTA
jgi:chromate reductase, NAD(P)H dehydrogenase (quinone)